MDIETTSILSSLMGKLKTLADHHTAVLIPGLLVNPETGGINWGNVFTGVLTAGLIASGSALIALSNKVSELSVLVLQRGTMIDQLPAVIEKLRVQEKAIDVINTGNVVATADRFRSSDAAKLEARLDARISREIDRLEGRLERNTQKGDYRK